ncbi:MAG: phosphoribosylglycinamide formyltransferase [Bauldia sp.]|nr:phosphoribosylglycinamide formyltransferase [Bauldia sp.]
MTGRKRVAILISGRGSNMSALIAAAAASDYPAEIALVLSDRPDARGLVLAAEAGIRTIAVDRKAYSGKPAFEAAMNAALDDAGAEIVCLAGFMRLLSADFATRWHDRLINIHPSILPAFRGVDTHERALAAGVRLHGCTVHYVRAEVDDGPIIVQAAVPVRGGDTVDALAARVLTAEHRIYPLALRLVASGRARVEGTRVVMDNEPLQAADPLIVPRFPEGQ